MSNDTIPIAEAIKRLSDANSSSSTRLTDLETKIAEIHNKIIQQNGETITEENNQTRNTIANRMDAVQAEMRQLQEETRTHLEKQQLQWTHLTKDVIFMKDELKKICQAILTNQITENDQEEIIDEPITTDHGNENFTRPMERQAAPLPVPPQPITQTIIVPPSSAIPSFSGSLAENPRQFLIRVREYTETVNRWDDQLLLNGVSQFLRDTALEWYCQLRMSGRKPHHWWEFTVAFLAQFNSPIRRARQEEEWRRCKQEESETINEFIVRLRALWREQKPNECENDLVKHLLCKMRNNLLSMIGVSRCGSVDELIHEAQRVEEILYQRSKQQRSTDYNTEEIRGNFLSTPRDTEDSTLEIQAMSAHQSYQRAQTQPKRNYPRTDNHRSTNSYGSQPYYNNTQQNDYSSYDVQCFACGKRGHTRPNCRSRFAQQNPRHYQKKANGAQDGRI
jgi:hypothetical protein